MKLKVEFRDPDGRYLFSLHGDMALKVQQKLRTCPEFKETTRKIEGKGEYPVLECTQQCGYKLLGAMEIIMNPGGYIKFFSEK